MSTNLRIVIADGDPAFRSRLSLWLRELGHNVTPFADHVPLINHCRHDCPDLIISDMHSPGHDGFAVAAQLRRECQVPIILMSGSLRPEQAARASGVGARILQKPVLPLNLVVAIAAIRPRSSI